MRKPVSTDDDLIEAGDPSVALAIIACLKCRKYNRLGVCWAGVSEDGNHEEPEVKIAMAHTTYIGRRLQKRHFWIATSPPVWP
jgi:hypothetical protein